MLRIFYFPFELHALFQSKAQRDRHTLLCVETIVVTILPIFSVKDFTVWLWHKEGGCFYEYPGSNCIFLDIAQFLVYVVHGNP